MSNVRVYNGPYMKENAPSVDILGPLHLLLKTSEWVDYEQLVESGIHSESLDRPRQIPASSIPAVKKSSPPMP